MESYIKFASPVNVPVGFFVGVKFNYAPGDTLALYCSSTGDVAFSANTAWEQFSNNTWLPFNSANSWNVSAAFYIKPVLCETEVGLETIIENSNTVNVFPNPASDILHVQGVVDANSCELVIHNVTGQSIEAHHIDLKNGELNTQFSLKEYPSGVYYVKVETAKTSRVLKFVKN